MTVGGIITEAKRIRTRNGDHMMFATLDDLEGSVEMLVFGKALAEDEARSRADRIVHRERPRRPQGSRQDLPVVQDGRALRAHRARRSSGRARRPRGRGRRRAAPSRCTCASTPRACRRR